MTQSYLKTVFEHFGTLFSFAIVIMYFLVVFWNCKILKTKIEKINLWLRIYTIAVSLVLIIVYMYIGVNSLFGNPLDATILTVMVVRPLIFLLGNILASSTYILIKETEAGRIWRIF